MSSYVFVSLGSNIGDKLNYLKLAIERVSSLRGVSLIKSSSLMVTSPVGVSGQDDYLNQMILLATELGPLELLKQFKDIEKDLGRKQRPRWAEREIDIDIVCYGDVVINSDALTLPHKEMLNRLFIIKGCLELMPDYLVPSYKKTFLQLFESLDNSVKEQKVRAFTS